MMRRTFIAGAALALSAGVALAADVLVSTGTQFPTGFRLHDGSDLNLMLDRINDLSDGTHAFTGDLLPGTDGTYDLGSSSAEWQDGYFDGTAYIDALDLNGTSVTSTAAELNILDGVTATATELNASDISGYITFSDDFLAGALDGKWSSTAGSGTGNQVLTVVANSIDGLATITTASDDGATSANCTSVTMDQLNFEADNGGLAIEARMVLDDVSEAAFFLGFTDTISTTVELPLNKSGTGDALAGDAANAAGVGYDVDGDTDQFFQGGIAASTPTAATSSGTAPSDGTYFTVRAEISAAGAVTGYVNGTAIGTATASAITATTDLTPALVVCNRSANQVIATVDYIWLQMARP